MLRYCSDCTFPRPFSGHGPVMVLFLSVYLYGTIIAKQYIYSIYNLLFLFSKRCGGYSFVAFKECAEMALVLESETVAYL